MLCVRCPFGLGPLGFRESTGGLFLISGDEEHPNFWETKGITLYLKGGDIFAWISSRSKIDTQRLGH